MKPILTFIRDFFYPNKSGQGGNGSIYPANVFGLTTHTFNYGHFVYRQEYESISPFTEVLNAPCYELCDEPSDQHVEYNPNIIHQPTKSDMSQPENTDTQGFYETLKNDLIAKEGKAKDFAVPPVPFPDLKQNAHNPPQKSKRFWEKTPNSEIDKRNNDFANKQHAADAAYVTEIRQIQRDESMAVMKKWLGKSFQNLMTEIDFQAVTNQMDMVQSFFTEVEKRLEDIRQSDLPQESKEIQNQIIGKASSDWLKRNGFSN